MTDTYRSHSRNSAWARPPIIKMYEALGAIGDQRVHVDGATAKVFSSSGNKHYTVRYDRENGAITANDNGSYWVGYWAIRVLRTY
jgi:hypothetical protein